jgi:type IV secretion system protein VirB10
MALAPPNDRDPRIAAGPGGEASIRPLVATDARPLPWWVFAIGVIVAALLLFVVLDARRRDAYAPPAARPNDAQGTPVQTPPLLIPPAPPPTPTPTAAEASTPPPAPIPMAPPPPRIIYVPQPAPPVIAPPPAPRAAGEPALVLDTTVGDAASAAPAGADGQPTAGGGVTAVAARATVMRHRATTVGQGTLIPAVLESALDSTRPGPARALVQRDVRGFDGSTILIQRGSRLIGEYRADLQPGQNRALVMWTRLVRPDGVTVAIGSPAADPLGRVGIKGKVNSHFFERFGAAILQSSLDVGVNLATHYAGGSTVVVAALPGALQSSTSSLTSGAQIQPTLRVRQGTAISVFVARDLDFTSVESRR